MNNKGYTLVEALSVVLLVFLVVIPISLAFALWTQRSMEFWIFYIRNIHYHVPLWLAWLTSMVLNGLDFTFCVLTEILRRVL